MSTAYLECPDCGHGWWEEDEPTCECVHAPAAHPAVEEMAVEAFAEIAWSHRLEPITTEHARMYWDSRVPETVNRHADEKALCLRIAQRIKGLIEASPCCADRGRVGG